jgi:hypothetical protein
MSGEEALPARIRDVDDEIARLVDERRRLAEQLQFARLAAGFPSYQHSDDVAAVAIFVERLGSTFGGDLAAVVLRRRAPRPPAEPPPQRLPLAPHARSA